MSLIIAPGPAAVKPAAVDLLSPAFLILGAGRATSASLAVDGEPRPSWIEPGPTALESAEWLGFLLGADGVVAEYLTPDDAERLAFERGHDAGDLHLWTVDPLWAAHLAERAERAALDDALQAVDDPADWADAERIETAGDRRHAV